MRTTLDLDESVLLAAKAIARDQGTSIGTVISRLARTGLQQGARLNSLKGFPIFSAASGARPITVDLVNDHRDDA